MQTSDKANQTSDGEAFDETTQIVGEAGQILNREDFMNAVCQRMGENIANGRAIPVPEAQVVRG
jgi:hypothetical protein